MKIISLEIFNVGPFAGKTFVSFDKTGIISLQGKQGTGKTTILNSLAFGFFDLMMKRDKKLLVSDIQNWYVKKSEGFYVIVVFKVDNDFNVYRTINSRNHSIYGSGFKLQKKVDDNWITLSDTNEVTRKKVEELINCDYITFTNSVYIRQDAVSALLDTPSKRLLIFLRLVGLEDKFKELDKRAKEISDKLYIEYEKNKSAVEALSINKIDSLTPLLEKENLIRIWMLNTFQKILNVRKDIVKLKRVNSQIDYWIREYELIGDKLDDINSHINSAKKDIESSERLIDTINFSKGRELNSLDSLIKQREELEEEKSNIITEMDTLLDVKGRLRLAKSKENTLNEKFIRLTESLRIANKEIENLNEEKVSDTCPRCNQRLPTNEVDRQRQLIEIEKKRLKKEVEDLRDDLSVVGNSLNSQRNTVEELSKMEKRYILLQQEKKRVSEALYKIGDVSESSIIDKYNSQIRFEETNIDKKNKEIVNYRKMILDLNKESKKIEKHLEEFGGLDYIAENNTFKNDLKDLENVKSKLKRTYMDFDYRLIEVQKAIYTHYETVQKYKELEEDLKNKKLKYDASVFLRDVIKRYRYFIVDSYLESINQYMNKYLKIFDFPYGNSRFDIEGSNLTWTFYNGEEWKDVRNLSGGETQTLLLSGIFSFFNVLSSRSISNAILCDEPLSGLDFEHQEIFFKFLEDIISKDVLTIISSHSTVILEEHFDEIWKIEKIDRNSVLKVIGG